ncbi:MAG: DMT family transporter [Alphaproteobacteria bacterium]|nr:DMT family transporter [Alphaproteobacteria bacterium]
MVGKCSSEPTEPASGRGLSVPPRLAAYLLVVLAVALYASNVVVSRGLRVELPPFGLAFWRTLVAALLLLPVTLPYMRDHVADIRRSWRTLVVLAFLLVVGGHAFIYQAVQQTTSVNAGIVNVTQPILAVGAAWLILGETLSRSQIAGLLLSVLGVICVATRGEPQMLATLSFNHGDLWMFAAMCSLALYAVLFKYWSLRLPPLLSLQLLLAIGALELLPFHLYEVAVGRIVEPDWAVLAAVGYLALFVSVFAVLFWNRGIVVIGAGMTAMFLALHPVFTTLLGTTFLGESVEAFHVIAFAMIFLGLILVVRGRPDVAPRGL